MTSAKELVEKQNQLFYTACRLQQDQHYKEAEEIYLRLLADHGEAPLLLYNLGLLYYETGKYPDAADCFAKGLAAAPDDPDMIFNCALSQKAGGNLAGAKDLFAKLLLSQPEDLDTLYNLAGCHRELGDYAKAIKYYQEIVALAPDHLSAHKNLAWTCLAAGDTKTAAQSFRVIVEHRPGDPAAGHMLAALHGETGSTVPAGYVTEVFDNYAKRYDKSLVGDLAYSVPEKLRKLLEQGPGPKVFDKLLDMGCGTGLAGQAFHELARTLHGVDLSSKMIELAREKQLYELLETVDLVSFLESTSHRYDLFVAADVFGYLGALATVLKASARAAKDDALLLFSTELGGGKDYTLQQNGRFAHGQDYVKAASLTAGWQILTSSKTGLRLEKGQWVEGLLWLAKRC